MSSSASGQIAVVGMSGRFPGAGNLTEFWANVQAGTESIRFFTDEELTRAGVACDGRDRSYVPAKGVLDGAVSFDAGLFDLPRRDASIMDPQFRVFLEVALHALEDAGYGRTDEYRIGLFAGAGANTYQECLREWREQLATVGRSQVSLLNQTDFLAGWVAYKLNLTGPAVTVQTACSTSLAAVHLAAQSLLNGECDVALAGGVSISFPLIGGYSYVEGGLYAADGHCRAFDARATGFVPGDGAGAVILRRLDDAVASGDCIRAVIRGSAMTNDGSRKIGFSAPSQDGIAAAVLESVAMSNLPCRSIGFLEAHGGATTLGDPIEIAAITQAYRAQTSDRRFCALGSVKSSIGHLNAAAGVASFIKAVLAIEHAIIPPAVNFDTPHPLLKLEQSPFYVPTTSRVWDGGETPRRAGVNSFGIGGTNVHVVIEEAPARAAAGAPAAEHLLMLSARTAGALDRAMAQLADYLEAHRSVDLADVAFTLAAGRQDREHRAAIVCATAEQAVRALRGEPERAVFRGVVESDTPVTSGGDATGARGDPLTEAARLWTTGIATEWHRRYASERRLRVPLPAYPFDHQSYVVSADLFARTTASAAGAESIGGADDPAVRYVGPANELESLVTSVWAFHLGVDRVDVRDRFFDVGGNSIAATRIVSALRETLQIELPLRVMLENPTPLRLCELIEASAREWELDVHAVARLVLDIKGTPRLPA